MEIRYSTADEYLTEISQQKSKFPIYEGDFFPYTAVIWVNELAVHRFGEGNMLALQAAISTKIRIFDERIKVDSESPYRVDSFGPVDIF